MRSSICCLTLLVCFSASHGAEKQAAQKEAFFKGKVVSLTALLKEKGVELDDDAAPASLALRAEDGKVYPLVKNAGSRMFFKDGSLLGREVRLTGKLVAGSGLLEVAEVHTYVKGKLHEVYYWCDNCALAYSEPGACLCCGERVKLKEVEVATPVGQKSPRLIPNE